MSQSTEQLLQQIIKENMGDNTLSTFMEFYNGESAKAQYNGAFDVFARLFGEEKAKEMLRPVTTLFVKEGNEL